MKVNREQSVGIFVDVQNMYYSAKNAYGAKVNFASILKEGARGRELVRAIAYVIKADIKEEKNFFDALEKIGYEVKAKDLQVFAGGAKKGDWDIGIAMDTIGLGNKLDVIVIVSGDGDFIPLVKHLQISMGCRVEVIAFGQSCSGKLKEEADLFIDMDTDKRKFLMSDNKPRAFAEQKEKTI